MISDIKITNGELVLGEEDWELVNDHECIKQDIQTILTTSPNTLFYDPLFGSKVLQFIHANKDSHTTLMLEQEIKGALLKDPNILPNSIKISIQDPLTITIQFSTTTSVVNTLNYTFPN